MDICNKFISILPENQEALKSVDLLIVLRGVRVSVKKDLFHKKIGAILRIYSIISMC